MISIYTLGSLFDGIGGWCLAAKKFGVEPIWASEIEKFPIEVTRRHFPNMVHLGDVKNIDGSKIPYVDVLTCGSPCQDLSVAGKREGLQGERSGLFKDAINIVRQMRRATGGKYPRFFCWENVPGAFNSGSPKGSDFRAVLEEIGETQIPMPTNGRWADSGLVELPDRQIAWRKFDAQYWGVPQRRKRIFLVCDFGGRSSAEVLFECEGLLGNPPQSGDQREGVATSSQRSINSASTGCVDAAFFDGYQHNNWKECTEFGALTTGCGRIRGGTPLVLEPKVFSIQRSDAYKESNTSHTLLERDYKDSTDLIVYEMQHSSEVIRTSSPGLVPTLQARMGTGGNQVPLVQMLESNPKAINIRNNFVRRLTPTECERLQGLPDGWTEGGTDTVRYKALGNGMAQPCADFVIENIVDVLNRQQGVVN